MIIACTYKTGGDFDAEYVIHLHEQLGHYGRFICFTDADDVPDYIEQVKLKHNWSGWWSKIEMLGYDEDILSFDLDTIIVGSITEMLHIALKGWERLIMLSDFYFPEKPASGLMYVPNKIGTGLYQKFLTKPDFYMAKYRGDQDFISAQLDSIDRWDGLLGQDYICSYKAHIIKSYPKHLKPKQVDATKSKIICFHGKPRPKDVKDIWDRIVKC